MLNNFEEEAGPKVVEATAFISLLRLHRNAGKETNRLLALCSAPREHSGYVIRTPNLPTMAPNGMVPPCEDVGTKHHKDRKEMQRHDYDYLCTIG